MIANYKPYKLEFKKPVLTSRGSMSHKYGYYLTLEKDGITGIGECSYIKGLSVDDLNGYEAMLQEVCREIEDIADGYFSTGSFAAGLLARYPSIAFGVETALLDLRNGGRHKIVRDSEFYAGEQSIPINGLVWMGTESEMQQQIEQKLAEGSRCIKIKVGAIDFEEECKLIEGIRKRYAPDQIDIRLDANGAFTEKDVHTKLRRLANYQIHSIEQPIKPEQYLLMHQLCREAIIPIALDEELIGTYDMAIKLKLIETIRPQYIILKPSLLGGLRACDEWVAVAQRVGIDWWATSALESNIGLNAIAQWAAAKSKTIVQGLGTGGLYTNNISSPLFIEEGQLKYDLHGKWGAM